MRKAGMDETATSLSGIKYQPDINTSLGFKALAAFEIKSGGTFTALAGIEIAFNSQAAGGGVSRLGFYGAAMLIQGQSSGGGNQQTPFGSVDEMQQTVSAKEQALGNFHELSIDKEGLKYFADEVFPELLTGEELFAAQVAIDFGGRNWMVWEAEFKREMIGKMPTEMFFHFFKSFTDGAKCNLNIKAEGTNEHHKIEGIFKAFAKAMKMAVKRDANKMFLPSTKGML